jgi:hypothetical protein
MKVGDLVCPRTSDDLFLWSTNHKIIIVKNDKGLVKHIDTSDGNILVCLFKKRVDVFSHIYNWEAVK